MKTPPCNPASTGLGTDLRLLVAASRLKQFTVAELADHAGVGRELTKSFLRRSLDVERSDVQTRGRRGRPERLWRVRPERALKIAAHVAEVSRVIGWAPMIAASEEPESLRLLKSALESLASR